MLPRWSRLWALLCLLLVIQHVSGEVFRIAPRQDDEEPRRTTAIESSTRSTRESARVTRTAESSAEETEDSEATESQAEEAETGTDSESASASATADETENETSEPTASSTAILTNGTIDDATLINATVPAGELPLPPELTPGWGVAGTILLLSGLAQTLIGIKNRMVHTFFSVAYAASLGTAVLIIYVMGFPVSNALQGGYVVAVVVCGCILGGASMFFREITEGVGCAVGGFCVSMWLLCLAPGGLLQPVASKAIFIACFTLGGFGFYFSHYTRDWALILMIAFSGATVTVLGIDCFSRAGLKEFWAYVWDLNDQLFPLGADTYPVTKGIRVETAAIIIIFLFGIISQIKLWKIVREQREKRAKEAAEGRRNLDEEEENIGRNIEEANARERRQWERVYGNGEVGSSTASRTSDDGEISTEKKHRDSQTDSSKRQSASVVEVIEMTDMADSEQQPKRQHTASLMSSQPDKDGRVTVRVASDDIPRSTIEMENEKAAASCSNDQTLPVTNDSVDKRLSQASSAPKSPAPPVIPLPFIIPVADDDVSDAERSSVATFADDEDAEPPTPGHRHSLAKRLSRLSRGSAELLGNLSHRSSRIFSDDHEHRGSTEELVIPPSRPRDDDGSVAATIDDESMSVGDRRSLPALELPKNIEINAELGGKDDDKGKLSPSPSDRSKFLDVDAASNANRAQHEHAEEHASEGHEKAKSATSGSSTRLSLTKDRLPKAMSRVALSYRTNEWAKHLSNAEAPKPDEIHIDQPQSQAMPTMEAPAPVHVNELQKAANEGTPAPAPAITRSDSQASNLSHAVSRQSSRQNVPAALAILTGEGQNRIPGTTPTNTGMPRTASMGLRRTSGGIEPIAEERDVSNSTPPIPEGEVPRVQSLSPPTNPADAHRSSTPGVVSYSSPQTLLGQRETFLRNKSQGNLLVNQPEGYQNNPYKASSDAGSLYNYPMYAAGIGADVDDLPLSQRKQLMRQNSLNPSSSTPSLQRLSGGIDVTSPDAPFDSHQPKRVSTVPTSAAREAALATFRQNVANDLRAGTPVINNTGRETPFTPQSLLAGREAEVQRNVEMSRNILLSQKEAEAQRREMQRREKEWADRAFDERMRTGDLLDIHREAMRKMQKHAKDA